MRDGPPPPPKYPVPIDEIVGNKGTCYTLLAIIELKSFTVGVDQSSDTHSPVPSLQATSISSGNLSFVAGSEDDLSDHSDGT